jgi:hypothetical protein
MVRVEGRVLAVGVLMSLLLIPSAAVAATGDAPASFLAPSTKQPAPIVWETPAETAAPALALPFPLLVAPAQTTVAPAQPARPLAIEYSDGYQLRRKIHRYASFATLPLMAAELALGTSLYNDFSDGKKTAHIVVGTGIIGLSAVNTVTGAWNLFGEGRKDPNGRTLRLVHGLLMLGADVGFAATAATGPGRENEHGGSVDGNRSTHRAIAISSISTATVGYLIMLIGSR